MQRAVQYPRSSLPAHCPQKRGSRCTPSPRLRKPGGSNLQPQQSFPRLVQKPILNKVSNQRRHRTQNQRTHSVIGPQSMRVGQSKRGLTSSHDEKCEACIILLWGGAIRACYVTPGLYYYQSIDRMEREYKDRSDRSCRSPSQSFYGLDISGKIPYIPHVLGT